MDLGLSIHRCEKSMPDGKQREIVVFVKTVVDVRQVCGVKELDREKSQLAINRSDLFAVELSLRLAAQTDASLVVCSMGVLPSAGILEKLYALGVGEIDLISDKAIKGADTFATAKLLSAYLRVRRPNSSLWLFGTESSDSSTAQVGPQVAAQMKCPLVSDVVSIEEANDGVLSLRTSGDSFDSEVKASSPLVIIVSTLAAPLRVATVKGVISARGRKCNTLSAGDLGIKSGSIGVDLSKTSVVKVRPSREVPRNPERIGGAVCLPFLFAQIAAARQKQDKPFAILGSKVATKNTNLLVSDFYSGDGISECRKIAAFFYSCGGQDLALYAIGSIGRSELTEIGIPKIYKCAESGKDFHEAVQCGRCLANYISGMGPEVVLFRASPFMRNVAPVAAALLDSGLAADCTSFALSPDVSFERPTFSESRVASIKSRDSAFIMATLRGGRFGGKEFACENPDCYSLECRHRCDSRLDTRIIKRHDSTLWNGDVVFVAGAGLTKESFNHLRLAARALKVDFGVTRPLVDKGWAERRYQVGQTGVSVSHPLYVSFGVSGELEHRIAIGSTTKIMAINTDSSCPMFAHCDYFIESDANDLIFHLEREITKGVKP